MALRCHKNCCCWYPYGHALQYSLNPVIWYWGLSQDHSPLDLLAFVESLILKWFFWTYHETTKEGDEICFMYFEFEFFNKPYHNPIINMYLWGDSNTHKFDESKDTIRQWLLCLVVEWFTREIIKFETVSQGKLISWFASNFSLS